MLIISFIVGFITVSVGFLLFTILINMLEDVLALFLLTVLFVSVGFGLVSIGEFVMTKLGWG